MFQEDYRLFWGDEIYVRHLHTQVYELLAVKRPSNLRHYFWVINGDVPESFKVFLLGLGGNWETDMGGLLTLHIPHIKVPDFEAVWGSLNSAEELYSGVQED